MDVYKIFLRLLYVFLGLLLVSILAWLIDQGYHLGCTLTQWVKIRVTNPKPARRYKRVKSSDLKCGRFLGEGCSGIIYEATWSRGWNLSLLARKAFPAVPADVFEYEAARLVELDHPNIVKVLGWTVDRRSCSLVMEHMKHDLFSAVEKRKEATRYETQVKFSTSPVPIPLHEAIHIISQIAEGVKYVHDQGLVHGDLKPNNVLVDSESGLMLVRVRVTDFGLTETKKRSTTLVSNQARSLQVLKWKAPELFEDLLGSSTVDSENMWTEITEFFPDLDVVKTSHASSSATTGRTEPRMQLADVYSFALTCSYVLGAQVPHDLNLGLIELRNGISSGARPHLPFECPKVLASLISKCWDPIPSRRPAFIDICKEMRTVKWELRQSEGKVQRYRNSKPQGSGKERLIFFFSKDGRKGSVISSLNNLKRLKTDALENMREPALDPILHISDEIPDRVPHVRPRMFLSNVSHLDTKMYRTEIVQTVTHEHQTQEHQDQGLNQVEEFEKLKAHSEWGHLFFDFNESGLEVKEIMGAGSQARIYEGQWKRDDGQVHSVAIKTYRSDFTMTNRLLHFFNSKGSDAKLGTSRVLRPLGGTLLENGRFALVFERFWGDLRKLIDFQMLKNKDIETPPFNQEMAIDIMLQIAEGLVELHEFGMIHKDVKSHNVLVHDLDKFTLGEKHGLISCAVIDYDDSEKVLGTGFWRAPEILYSKRLLTLDQLEFTQSVDVYSYGMTCYEILTGKTPFQNESLSNYDLVLSGNRPELPASLHPQLRDLVTRCWAANPLERPTSLEIVFALKKISNRKMMLPPILLDSGASVMIGRGEDRLLC